MSESKLELEQHELHYRAILDTAVDSIITIDHHGVILSANRATEAMFGYHPDELIGTKVNRLMPLPQSDEHDDYLRRYLETREPRIIGIGRNTVAKRKDGATFPISLAISEIDNLGIFCGIVRDITDETKAQEQLLLHQRMATIGQTMTGIAHESRGALQRILASAENLELDAADDPEMMLEVRGILRSAEHLRSLLEEVRNYAAPLRLDYASVNLPNIWRQAFDEVRSLQGSVAQSLALDEVVRCEETMCEVDPFRIQQVFRNLFDNAASAMSSLPKDQQVISIQCVETQWQGSPAIEVRIQDRGPGVKVEQSDSLFEPFFTTKPTGTGLGLAIVQRIVNEHGGHIALEQEQAEETGATFVVTLPLKPRR